MSQAVPLHLRVASIHLCLLSLPSLSAHMHAHTHADHFLERWETTC